MQDIHIKTLCNGYAHDNRAQGHPQYRVWHPGEGEDGAKNLAIGKGQTTNWKMKSDKVYNRGSGKTHEQEPMNYFNLESLMQEHSSRFIRPRSLITHLLKGVGSLNYFVYFS